MANNSKLDLRKLVWMHSLKQFGERIKLLYYNKEEIDEILEEYLKNVSLNDAILEKIDQVVAINIEPSQNPGAFLVNGEEIVIPGIATELYWETFNSTPPIIP